MYQLTLVDVILKSYVSWSIQALCKTFECIHACCRPEELTSGQAKGIFDSLDAVANQYHKLWHAFWDIRSPFLDYGSKAPNAEPLVGLLLSIGIVKSIEFFYMIHDSIG